MIGVLKHATVLFYLRANFFVNCNALGRLAQLGRDLAALFVIQIQNQRALTYQSLANCLGINIGVAVHVAADPRGVANQRRYRQLFSVVPINSCDGSFDVVVERRHRPIQHVGHEEQHVLELVCDGHLFRWVFGGLPAGCYQ